MDLVKELEKEISSPIPWSSKVSDSVVEDEMELFRKAQSQLGK